ncbi:hypothetical protein Ae201684P_009547 [Aphanomyces euteiches]|uniref:Uncharacterized protein n=1 Tax=Aphanomyces euteiches TaxID=100861 RepID=A0A6G0WL69_9STRA|nr:hypothetical protein Ae201684_014114 [Aphanomyces euteiches]KAH9096315.1 hypothetical protein Ae201684P_009547 [Aphanomyces euteiches]
MDGPDHRWTQCFRRVYDVLPTRGSVAITYNVAILSVKSQKTTASTQYIRDVSGHPSAHLRKNPQSIRTVGKLYDGFFIESKSDGVSILIHMEYLYVKHKVQIDVKTPNRSTLNPAALFPELCTIELSPLTNICYQKKRYWNEWMRYGG